MQKSKQDGGSQMNCPCMNDMHWNTQQRLLADHLAGELVVVAQKYNTCPQGFALTLARAMLATLRGMGLNPAEAQATLSHHLVQQYSNMNQELN